MILWQEQASAIWLAAHETELMECAGPALAIVTAPDRARAMVQVVCRRRKEAEELQRKFGGRIGPLPRDWAKATRGPAPIRIGRRLEIVGKPMRPSRMRSQLIIPAADAFGTGEHSTTAMSLRLLEETTRKWPDGWAALDVGTGTGILALAARQFGAAKVLGLDNDPRAIANARSNARLNHLSRAAFVPADVLKWQPTTGYDIITANLFSELLIAALPTLQRALLAEGRVIISGILRAQSATVVRALRRAGFQIEKQRRRGKWLALLLRRRPMVARRDKTQLKPR